jgi:hypothetical protein
LQIDDNVITAGSREELEKRLTEIKTDLEPLNKELAAFELEKLREITKVDEETKKALNGTEMTPEKYYAELQKIVDEQKKMKELFQQFMSKNAPEGANEDVAKMFDL